MLAVEHMKDQGLARRGEPAWGNSPNIGNMQRLFSVLAGSGCIFRALKRPSLFGVILGMAGISLVYRGASGYCLVFAAMDLNTSKDTQETKLLRRRNVTIEKTTEIRATIVINRPPADLYRFWRSFDNLPRVMRHVQSVFVINDHLSYWVVQTLAGVTLEWDAKITHDVENERIAWRSFADADIDNAGFVEFEPIGDGQKTKLTLTLQYALPTRLMETAAAELFGEHPEYTLAQDLQRLKDLMETGEVSRLNSST